MSVPTSGQTHVGVVHVFAASPRDVGRFRSTLSPAELERAAARRTPIDVARAVVSAGLLRHAVEVLTGEPAWVVEMARWCRVCSKLGDHGRPVAMEEGGWAMPNVYLSSAYAGDVVLAAASAQGPVGIDVEPLDGSKIDGDYQGFDRLALSDGERELVASVPPGEAERWRLRAWVRKEAILKATGYGLSIEPSRLDVSGGVLRAWPPEMDDDLAGGCQIVDLSRVRADHVASLAYLGPRPPLVLHAPRGVR